MPHDNYLKFVITQPIPWQFNQPIKSITWGGGGGGGGERAELITLTLKMSSAQVVETSVTVTNSFFAELNSLGQTHSVDKPSDFVA